jgi:hypothetical protein
MRLASLIESYQRKKPSMRMRRYEILLPLKYNDGSDVEEEKFLATNDEIVSKFNALTIDPVQAKGIWVYDSIRYEDRLIRLRIDTVSSRAVRKFFKNYKEVLKDRFKQIDIWMTSYEIEVI